MRTNCKSIIISPHLEVNRTRGEAEDFIRRSSKNGLFFQIYSIYMLDENQVREDSKVRVLTDDLSEEDGQYGWIDDPDPDTGDSADVLVEMRDSGEKYVFRRRELERANF